MRKRFFNSTTLAGVGSLLLALLPYFTQEGSKMNPTFWALVGIGAILVLVGILKVEKRLSGADITEIMQNRRQYLPQLRDTTSKMLVRMRELSIQAGKFPLEEYYDRYLARNNTYQQEYRKQTGKQKDKTAKRKVAIITSLHKKGFHYNNLYLCELEDRDKDGLVALRKEYETYFARNRDASLARTLNKLFEYAQKAFSCHTLAEMGKYNELPYKDTKYIAALYDKPKWLDCLLERQHRIANKRFDELLRGEDL